MKRLWLGLPVLLVCVPLAIYLVLATGAQPSGRSAPADTPLPDVAEKEQGPLPSAAKMEKLARQDPVAFLEYCLARYDRDVQGYYATMQKQERLQGKLCPKEVMEVAFREKPFSVFLHWRENPRKAESVLYVKGENDGKMLVHPAGFAGKLVSVVERDVDGEDAKASGRYTLDQFGIKDGMVRTLEGWKAAQKRGKLKVEYLGEIRVKEAGNRLCWKLHRTYDQPEHDGVTDLTIYVDKENWLQVGSVIKGKDNMLIGEYFFRDIRLNPEFKKDQFDRAALTE